VSNPKFARDLSELMTPEQMGQISGLEFIAGIKEGRYPAPPISKTLNYRLDEVEKGRVVFSAEPDFAAMNPIGSIHGGWFGTLLDSCMACAVQTMLPKGSGYTTLEYKINILRPVMPGSGVYKAIGLIDHVGRRTGIARGEIRHEASGKCVATGSTTCLIMDLP